MYRQFVRNYAHYMKLNIDENNKENYRYAIAKSLESLTNIDMFKGLKEQDPKQYNEVANIIYEIKGNINNYPSFKSFTWELWGYGFDGVKGEVMDEGRLKEQLKCIDLLLGTQYWH